MPPSIDVTCVTSLTGAAGLLAYLGGASLYRRESGGESHHYVLQRDRALLTGRFRDVSDDALVAIDFRCLASCVPAALTFVSVRSRLFCGQAGWLPGFRLGLAVEAL